MFDDYPHEETPGEVVELARFRCRVAHLLGYALVFLAGVVVGGGGMLALMR